MGVFHTCHRAHQVVLDVKRQAGRDAVGVDLVRGQAFRLQENLVAVLVGKAVDLVFHAGAIARAHALDLAHEHRAAVKAGTDDVVGAFVGMGDPARHLTRVHVHPAHEAEHRHHRAHATGRAIAGLLQALGKINRAAVNPGRGSGLQSALRQLQFLQPRTQRYRRWVSGTARRIVVQAHMDLAVEESPRRQHHRLGAELDTHLGHGTDHAVTLHHQVIDRLLEQPQIGLVLQHAADGRLVQNAVGLRTGGAHGRALAGIENAKLDTCLIGGQRHRTAHRVHLFDQVALADAADRWVAAHLPQRLNVVREQQSLAAHAGSRKRSLGASMAAADDDDIEFLWVKHGVQWARKKHR